MKNYKLVLIVLFVTAQMVAQNTLKKQGYLETNRTKTNLNLGWKFTLGNENFLPVAVDFDDSKWEKVSVPHTTQLASIDLDSVKEVRDQKTYLRDIGWYRKSIKINAKPDEKVFIEFEGVHNATELWVNGKKVGSYEINGYVPFHFDITNFVKFGAENLIAIKADNSFNETISPDPHITDYVKFGGLYRDVYLVTTNKMHVTFNWEKFDAGVHITTPTVNKNNGTVSVKTTIKNENNIAKNCKIETKIINAQGFVVKKIISQNSIAANSEHTFRQSTTIEDDFHTWSPNSPYLYRAHSIIYENETPVDFVENTFGFRTFSLEKGKGFMLNGEPLFLVGVNRHQNYPNIGDAVPNSFHYNEALQYKKAGMNAIRLSHYTQDDAFLKACDELGIIVYEEVATWIDWGDETWFAKLEEATRVMIRNHRNHPSIVFWGAGINHRGPVPRMQTVAKEEDPFRLTASASSAWNGVKNEGVTDIYATMDYRRSEFAESAFSMVMEHGSSPNSEVNQFHISRYKGSKNNIAALAWLGADYNHLLKNNGTNYITNYAILSAYRVPKPVYYWYQSELVDTPIVHIASEVASTNGKVRVFSNCQEVELYLNGKLIARQFPDNTVERKNLAHPSFTFKHNWVSGELKAIGYSNGLKVTEFSRKKAGKPHSIKVEFNINDQPFYAGGSDLRLVHAYVVDENGEVVTNATSRIKFSVEGSGQLLESASSDVNPAKVYDGVASIYLKGTEKVGKIKVVAKSDGLKSGFATIEAQLMNLNELENLAKPIYDYEIERFDIGGEDQLVQFDWKSWTQTSTGNNTFEIEVYNNAKVLVSANEGDIKWLGYSTMLGDLSFMGADGVYNEKGNLKLSISKLPKGVYTIETYHHTRRNGVKMTNAIEVNVNDALGKLVKMADDHIVDYYLNDSTGERAPLSVKTQIVSNGTDAISIEFNNKAKGDMWLNGLVFQKIAE